MARTRPPGPKPYSKELADAVLTHIAGGGAMEEIYRNPDLPCRKTIYSWKTKHKDFADALEEAKFAKADAIAEEALSAARNLYLLATQCENAAPDQRYHRVTPVVVKYAVDLGEFLRVHQSLRTRIMRHFHQNCQLFDVPRGTDPHKALSAPRAHAKKTADLDSQGFSFMWGGGD